MLNLQLEPSKEKINFTFWDMDDTCIDTWNKSIKNPHLLLPIMLFQSYGANQYFGILTNRDKKQENDSLHPSDYPLEKFQKELASFGIMLCQEYITFCGGKDSFNDKFEVATKGLDLLSQFFSKLEIADNDESVEQKESRLAQTQAVMGLQKYFQTTITPKIFYGKNYYILDFLEKRLDESRTIYNFDTWSCLKENLIVRLVDDNPDIAEPTCNLGKNNFIGITATRGGKDLPKEGDTTDNYYSVTYLHDVAWQLGLANYASNINATNHPMLQIASLLYLWQQNDQDTKLDAFIHVFKLLDATQCEQICAMLDYICKYAKPQTGYRSVDVIYTHCKAQADKLFLENVYFPLTEIDITLARIQLELSKIDSPNQPKTKKNKLFQKQNKDKSATSLPITTTNAHQLRDIWLLEDKRSALIARLKEIATSSDEAVAQEAKNIHNSFRKKDSPNLSVTIVTENTFTPLANNSNIALMKKSRSDEHSLVTKDKDKEIIKEKENEKAKKKDKDKKKENRKSVSYLSGFK